MCDCVLTSEEKVHFLPLIVFFHAHFVLHHRGGRVGVIAEVGGDSRGRDTTAVRRTLFVGVLQIRWKS